VRLTPHAGRLTTFAGVTMAAGVLMGQPEVVAFGAAALAVLAYGLCQRVPALTATLLLSEERAIEGDDVQVTVRLHATGGPVDSATVRLGLHKALYVSRGADVATVSLRDGETRDVTLHVRPKRWGVFHVGPAFVTAYGQGRMVAAMVQTQAETLRALPRRDEFSASPAHPHTRALSGTHAARVTGVGVEPVGVREYRPGDPLRHVNWRVSARRGDLHVTEQRPERNAEVVLFLDTYVDRGPEGATNLDIAVRAAAGIAEHYIGSMDRVGVVGFGGVLRWLTADAGRVQMHRILEHLMGTDAIATYASKDVSVLPSRALPPRALVIALSPLLDTRAAGAIAELAHRGYGLVVVDTSARPLLPSPTSWSRDLAQRVWLVERDALIHRLGDAGVPVVPWLGPGTLDVVLHEVSRLHARPRVALR
jgi:uncharacterized protein (DUF58 family)